MKDKLKTFTSTGAKILSFIIIIFVLSFFLFNNLYYKQKVLKRNIENEKMILSSNVSLIVNTIENIANTDSTSAALYFLEKIRFGNDTDKHFFALTSSGELVIDFYDNSAGDNVLNVKDSESKFYFKEMISKAQKYGKDFMEFSLKEENIEKTRKIVSYFEFFKPLDLIIGSTIFVDEIEIDSEKTNENFYHELLKYAIIIIAAYIVLIDIFQRIKKRNE